MGPNRYQCWWYSSLLGWRCDAYPMPGPANARLEEVQDREYFTRGLVIDMEEHLTSQEGYSTRQEFERYHAQYTEAANHV